MLVRKHKYHAGWWLTIAQCKRVAQTIAVLRQPFVGMQLRMQAEHEGLTEMNWIQIDFMDERLVDFHFDF